MKVVRPDGTVDRVIVDTLPMWPSWMNEFMSNTKQIAEALAGEAPALTADELAEMYGKLWALYDQMVSENESMKAQLAMLREIAIKSIDRQIEQIADQLPNNKTLH